MKSYIHILYAFIIAASLAGCMGAASSPTSPAQVPISGLDGYVQKGPFIKGSTIEVQELTDSLAPSGKIFSLQTTDNMGSFSLGSDIGSDYIEIIGSGFYFNEVSGAVSTSTLTLRTLSYLDPNAASNVAPDVRVNILTTLSKARIQHLIENTNEITRESSAETVYGKAKDQAEYEILNNVFHINPETDIEASELSEFDQMDISKTGDSNAVLLAVSVILQGGNTVGELSELINQVSADVETDGTLDDATLVAELRNNEMSLDLSTIRTNLEARYASVGTETDVVPAFEDYIDTDGDGTINKNDTTAPTVASVLPLSGATNAAENTTIQAVFDKNINANSLSASSITLKNGDTTVAGSYSYSWATNTLTFTPTSNLLSFTTYTATVAGTVKDGSGNALGGNYVWSFTTSDTIAPTVSSTVPAASANITTINSNVTVTFNEAMDDSTITDSTFTVSIGGVPIAGVVSYNAGTKTATFNPTENFSRASTYTAALTTGVKDENGTALAGAYSWTFNTSVPSPVFYKVLLGGAASFAPMGDIDGDGIPDLAEGFSTTYTASMYSVGEDSILWNDVETVGSTLGAFGGKIAAIPDLNNDGHMDVVVGAYSADPSGLTDAGSIYVYSGAVNTGGDSLQDVLFQKDGAVAGDAFGTSLAGGDVNNDGYGDFIVGAPYADTDDFDYAGSVYVYSGYDGSQLYRFDGNDSYEMIGGGDTAYSSLYTLAAADVNNDGYDDIIIGAPGGNSGIGYGGVYAYSGETGDLLWKIDGMPWMLGSSVGSMGDIDGDGADDIIVGCSGYSSNPTGRAPFGGAVYVYSGDDQSVIYQKMGENASELMGKYVANVGDIDGDGYNDFAANSSIETDSATTSFYSGIDGALLFTSPDYGWISTVGDINNDGLDDIAIQRYDYWGGAVNVIYLMSIE